MRRNRILLTAMLLAFSLFIASGCSSDPEKTEEMGHSGEGPQKKMLAFCGGPTGGTFNFFANKIASIISVRYDWLEISPKGSGGSVENLRTLSKNGADIAIVYSGDAFLGRNGKLPHDSTRYDHVQSLAFLYGAPAQLVVRRDADIDSVEDLVGKVVAIGNPGSGAALSAERYFKHLGLWGRFTHSNLGYSQAAAEFAAGKIDAFWVLVGYPNSSVIEAASTSRIKLINVYDAAVASGFFDVYPFYSKVEIPVGTYDGQDEPIMTFQDSALWCASEVLSADTVYECLLAVYSQQGLRDMTAAHKAAKSMSLATGLDGLSIPLHPGAIRFWQEMGSEIPENLIP